MIRRGTNPVYRALWNPKFTRRLGETQNVHKSIVSGFSWMLLIYREAVAAAAVLILFLPIVGIMSGISGLAGFMVGFLVVYICFTIGVATVVGAQHVKVGVPQALLVSYVVKVLLMAMVLLLVPMPEALKHGWTLGGAVIGAVLWLSVEAITIMNSKILYFDPKS